MVETATGQQVFKLRAPLLSKGRLDTVMAETDRLRIWLKCYAEGGENTLHAHPAEDHSFIVLQGRARFFDKDGNATLLGRNEGIMLPRGTYYWFQSCGDEPLVMLRVGARPEPGSVPRLGMDGQPLPGKSKENKHENPVVIEGAFYE